MLFRDVADEVTQDVFVRAWEKLDTFRGEAAFGSWLYQVAIHEILGRRRREARRNSRRVQGDGTIERTPTRAARPDLAVDLEAALEELPDGARQVFVLHDVEGYRHREIAELLGVSVGTSKSQLHRARQLLRAELTA